MQLCMSYASVYYACMNVMYAQCMLTRLTGRLKLEVNQHRSMSKYSANLDHM
jgi:hypothetical protein